MVEERQKDIYSEQQLVITYLRGLYAPVLMGCKRIL